MVKELYKTLFEKKENKLITGIVGMVFITTLLGIVFYFEANAISVVNLDDLPVDFMQGGGSGGELAEFTTKGPSLTGYTNENEETDESITIEIEKLVEITCKLVWQDEDSNYQLGTNEPDEFQVSIIAPNNEILAESGVISSGTVSTTAILPDYTENDFADNYIGSWTIRVTAGNCGDDSAMIPIFGLRTTPDTGNDWTLEYSYIYLDFFFCVCCARVCVWYTHKF